jgi:hypothetical protein
MLLHVPLEYGQFWCARLIRSRPLLASELRCIEVERSKTEAALCKTPIPPRAVIRKSLNSSFRPAAIRSRALWKQAAYAGREQLLGISSPAQAIDCGDEQTTTDDALIQLTRITTSAHVVNEAPFLQAASPAIALRALPPHTPSPVTPR